MSAARRNPYTFYPAPKKPTIADDMKHYLSNDDGINDFKTFLTDIETYCNPIKPAYMRKAVVEFNRKEASNFHAALLDIRSQDKKAKKLQEMIIRLLTTFTKNEKGNDNFGEFLVASFHKLANIHKKEETKSRAPTPP